jgi:hypothetical protein
MSVTICYPTPGASVPGGGGVFAWGTVSSDDSVSGAYAQWQSAGAAPITLDGVSVTPPAPCNWAFEFSNVGVGPNVTLTISAASGDYTVPFTCLGLAK